MTHSDFIPVSKTNEFNKIVGGVTCAMTKDQGSSVASQVAIVYGECGFSVSELGLVFSNESDFDFMYLGRIDAKFNFYSK